MHARMMHALWACLGEDWKRGHAYDALCYNIFYHKNPAASEMEITTKLIFFRCVRACMRKYTGVSIYPAIHLSHLPFIHSSVCLSVCLSVCRLVGWSVGRLVSWSVNGSVNKSVSQSVLIEYTSYIRHTKLHWWNDYNMDFRCRRSPRDFDAVHNVID